jgi:pseudouridine kinase
MDSITEREQEILDCLKKDPMISQKELAEKIGISRSSAAVHITNLMKKGIILGKKYVLQEEAFCFVAGGANIDITASAVDLAAGDSSPGTIHFSHGGVGRNIAETLASLGEKVFFSSCLGRDVNGDQLRTSLEEKNIVVEHIKYSDKLPTGTYTALLSNEGDLLYGINHMDVLDELDASWFKKRKRLIEAASYTIIDSNLPCESLEAIADCSNTCLYADPVSVHKARRLLPLLSKIDCIKPNILEAELLCDMKIQSRADLVLAIEKFIQMSIQRVALSLGSEGIAAGDKNEIRLYAPIAIEQKSSQGAGDSFLAAWAFFEQRNFHFFEAIERALVLASLSAASEDPVPNLEAFEEYFNTHKENIRYESIS